MSDIPSQAEYERNERSRAYADEQRINKASLGDRKAARDAFHEAMAEDPATVAERISWLLDGNYGFGQMMVAKEAVTAKRMNREALLTQSVGVFEWQCPRDMSRAAWTKLTPAQKKALSTAVAVVIAEAEAEEE
jgi:hypothetical protein